MQISYFALPVKGVVVTVILVAVWIIVIVVYFVIGNQTAAAFAGDVVVLSAAGAKGYTAVTLIIAPPYPFTAAITDCGMIVKTTSAKYAFVKFM